MRILSNPTHPVSCTPLTKMMFRNFAAAVGDESSVRGVTSVDVESMPVHGGKSTIVATDEEPKFLENV